MQVVASEKIPIKIWTDHIEEGALQQAKNLANLPFAFKWIAIMPDVHQGYGMPIGGVLATHGMVIPNAVGVDISCGVTAYKTGLHINEVKPFLRQILNQIQRDIPTGFKHQKIKQESKIFKEAPLDLEIIAQEFEAAHYQLGTLGGGNHFLEIQRDTDDTVWIMLHSGSRNLGKKVADYYNRLAIKLNEEWEAPVPKEHQLAFLPLDTSWGQDYMQAMKFCMLFAKENRKLMLDRALRAFKKFVPGYRGLEDGRSEEPIDVHHNYAAMENHYGQNVLVHRKGAVRARAGEIAIIPGSMGTPSYICRGRGNSLSFMSCSHGAGRAMSRTAARKKISVETVILEMRKKGIELFKARKSDVAEECHQAYKDIDTVMANQEDLVEIVTKLEPVGVLKG